MGRIDAGIVEGIPAAAVRQCQFRGRPNVLGGNTVRFAPGGVRDGRAGHHQIGAHTVDVEGRAQRRDPVQLGVGQLHPGDPGPGRGDLSGQYAVGAGIPGGEGHRVGLVGQSLTNDIAADRHVAGGRHVDGEAEPVEQLGTQLALLGVHRADQHEPRRVGVRDPVAFDVHPTHGGRVEQDVDQMVGQQVDLVDVEHAPIRSGQQAGRERVLAVAKHLL